MEVILESIISCPYCGFLQKENIPTDSCQFFYECKNCHTVLKPKQGDCCVYCSFGSVKCPSIQQKKSCC
ncbi:MAG: GDCCVxC domain-containing (seleno)protein [Bacteroidales bacterium]|nr:GDCCVxC domain-containing (seleno)protein [Bacteroidales bacterium]